MTLGEMTNFPLQTAVSEKNPIHIKNEAKKVDVIPLLLNVSNARMISFSHLEGALKSSGFYDLTDEVNFNEIIGLNYNRIESNITPYTTDEIIEGFAKIGWIKAKPFVLNTAGKVQINQLKATEYWRILLILALLFIMFEILLLKFWKQ